MSLLLLLPHNEVANYVLTAQGGVYNLTGGSVNINYTGSFPVYISATALSIGTLQNPGAQSITVPSDAQAVVVFTRNYVISGSTLSLTSDFSGSFTTVQDSSGGEEQTTVSYASVSSTGSKTITPSWSVAPAQGPIFIVAFVKNINPADFYRAAYANALDSSGSSATTNLTSSTTDLILVLNSQYNTGNSIPTTMSGCTSLLTQGVNSEGARLQSVNSPTSSTTITGSTTSYDGIAAISIKYGSASSGYTLTALGGSYSLSGQSAVLKRSKLLVSTGGSYALTGASAVLKRSKVIAASGGSYTLTGANINMVKGRVMTAQGGTYSLTGASANLLRSKCIIASGGSYTLTGANAAVSRNRVLTATGGSYTLTGSSAILTWTPGAVNYLLTAQGGAYTVTGAQATLLRSKKIIATGGSYTLSGSSANIYRSKVIIASGGSYSLTGASAVLKRSKYISASGGSYTLTGQPAVISRNRYLTAQGGSYNLTGQSITITWTGNATNYTLICQGGSYVLYGASANINRNRNLTAQGGSYSLTGASAILLRSKYLSVSGGSYTYTGQSANLLRSRQLVASGGSYTLTGASVVITKTTAGGYPNPDDVRLGVMYGPTGTEYTGTLDVGKKFRIDIATGHIVMIIDSDKVMSL